jgi:3-dehydroquinate synthase class II
MHDYEYFMLQIDTCGLFSSSSGLLIGEQQESVFMQYFRSHDAGIVI